MLKWLSTPHVQEFWDRGTDWTEELVFEKYGSYIDGYKLDLGEKKPILAFIMHLEDAPIGYIQFYKDALDLFIGEKEMIGKGIGSALLKKFLNEHIWPHFNSCNVDPEKTNKKALRFYAKAGFVTTDENETTVFMTTKKMPERNPIIIFGSSRMGGDTLQAVKTVFPNENVPIVDLNSLNIGYYDYVYQNRGDDFLPLIERIVKHNPIILASPVYWYSVSAQMKTFIDRWSDLLEIRKDLGSRLAGKELYIVTSYGGEAIGFEEPIQQTCDYMEMRYKGCYYYYVGNDKDRETKNAPLAQAFASKIWDKEFKENN